MLAENNILSPANGKPIATPTQDMVLGLFYLTKVVPNEKRYAKAKNEKERAKLMPRFASPSEVVMAHNHGQVNLQEEIMVRLSEGRTVRTTPGRVLFSLTLPKEVDYFDDKHSFGNQVMTKGQLGLIVAVARTVGKIATARMLDLTSDSATISPSAAASQSA